MMGGLKAGILEAALFPRQRTRSSFPYNEQQQWEHWNRERRCSLWSPPRIYLREREREREREKERESGWGYNRATLFLGDINTGTWSQI
jgi:hypothetical protein